MARLSLVTAAAAALLAAGTAQARRRRSPFQGVVDGTGRLEEHDVLHDEETHSLFRELLGFEQSGSLSFSMSVSITEPMHYGVRFAGVPAPTPPRPPVSEPTTQPAVYSASSLPSTEPSVVHVDKPSAADTPTPSSAVAAEDRVVVDDAPSDTLERTVVHSSRSDPLGNATAAWVIAGVLAVGLAALVIHRRSRPRTASSVGSSDGSYYGGGCDPSDSV